MLPEGLSMLNKESNRLNSSLLHRVSVKLLSAGGKLLTVINNIESQPTVLCPNRVSVAGVLSES